MGYSKQPGFLRGQHLTTYIQDVKNLKKSGNLAEAEKLLFELADATEEECRIEKVGVALWYYEELAKVYRKMKEYKKEVDILERFAKQ